MLAGTQLSIYPEPEREIVVVDAPSVLETQIGVARRGVTGVARDVHARVHGVVSQWIGIEHAVERAFISPLILGQTGVLPQHTLFLCCWPIFFRPCQGPRRPR